MAMPTFSMRQMLESGVHFGHQTQRWNPKMAPYLFGARNGIHIIDLQQSVPMMHAALQAVRDVAAAGGRVLFVGTKRQASDAIAECAGRCAQYYVNHRWLGGTLTNWKTISNSIRRLKALDEQLSSDQTGLTKKELLRLTRERDKLERALGGIKDMGGVPDIMVVIDTNKEAIAIAEAKKLSIPVVAVVDSNSNPEGIDHVVPGNDDALRAITFYCTVFADAVLDGIQEELAAEGGDLGAAEEPPVEALPETPAPAEAAKPEAEPATEAAPAEAAKPEAEPEEATVEPAAEPATEAATEPAAEVATEPAEEPPTEPATEAAAEAEETAETAKPADDAATKASADA